MAGWKNYEDILEQPARPPGCTSPDHARFRGVFFAKHGCLACELEAAQVRVAELEREVAALRRWGNKDCTAMADTELEGRLNE